MRLLFIITSLLTSLISCTPATSETTQPNFEVEAGNADDFKILISPFLTDLRNLGIVVDKYRSFRYEGEDQNAFIQATNQFYLTYPGFCPLEEGSGFFASEDGLIFMTLASNNTSAVRGFLYDQSQRPKLRYAYFSGSSKIDLTPIMCKTAKVSK